MVASAFTDTLVAWGTAGLGVFTLLLAIATIRLVGHTRASAEIARAAVNAEVQPVLVDVPPNAVPPPDIPRDGQGKLDPFFLSFDGGSFSPGEIDPRDAYVGRASGRLYVSVPLRNVGRGLAKLEAARLDRADDDASVVVRRPIVPVGESTRIDFVAPASGETARGDDPRELSVTFEYTDIGGGQVFSLSGTLLKARGDRWYLTNLRHEQVLRRRSTWLLDNIAVSALGLGFRYERAESGDPTRDRFAMRSLLGLRAGFSRASSDRARHEDDESRNRSA